MTIARALGRIHSNLETATRADEFIAVCRYLMLAAGKYHMAQKLAEEHRASEAVVRVLKSAAEVGGFGSWASPLADFKPQIASFVAGLSNFGVFDAMLTSMIPAPLSSTVVATNVIAQGFVVGEASAKQISRLNLTNGTLEPAKAHCAIVLSNELLRFSPVAAQALLKCELTSASVLAIDSTFVNNILLSGVSAGTSEGSTAISVRNDIAALLAAVPTDATSKLFLLVTPLIAKIWAAMGATSTNGATAFENMGPLGGEVCGVRVIPTDALLAGMIVLCDAGGIAAASDAIQLSVLSEGSIMSDSAPDSPQTASTSVQSLWQLNLTALRVERWWGAEKVRPAAVAALSNGNSYTSGFSPP